MNKQELIEHVEKYEMTIVERRDLFMKEKEEVEHFEEWRDGYQQGVAEGQLSATRMVLAVIKELEQPKITHEQAWNKIAEAYPESPQSLRNKLDNAVFGSVEKVTVPRFVAEWYVKIKHYTLAEKIRQIESTDNKQLFEWYSSRKGRHNNNMANAQELIAQMDLYGYEIEEPKYYVKLPETAWGTYLVKTDEGELIVWQNTNEGTPFTEAEIKAIDERYWAFAVPVDGSVKEID